MEAVMSSLLRGECVTLSRTLNNLDETVNRICNTLKSKSKGLSGDLYLATTAFSGNGALLEINFLSSLFGVHQCKRLQELQQRLIADSKVFDALVYFLGDQDYLTAYSACKALVAFLTHDAEGLTKLKYLAQSCLKTHQSGTNTDKSHYHRILLTFDLFRLLIKKWHASGKNNLSCSCGEMQQIEGITQEADLFGAAMPSLILLLEPFQFCFKKRDLQLKHVDTTNVELSDYDMKCLKDMKSKELDILFLSFLKMIKAFIKRSSEVPSVNIIKEVANFLVNCLKEGFQNSCQALKTCFDTLATVLQFHGNISPTEGPGLQVLQRQTGRSLCELIEWNWLRKLPYRSGPVGFGGVNFQGTSSLQMSDLTLLRRLTNLIFISVQVITKRVFAGEDVPYVRCSARSLEHLKTFVESLKLDPTSDWISQLFADEDEMMVSVLFHALQIYKQTLRWPLDHALDLANKSAQGALQGLLCPHHLFWNYLDLIDFDHSVLLDLLMSCETNFLEYFTSYLHLVRLEWDKFSRVMRAMCTEDNILEQAGEVDFEVEIPPKRMKHTNSLSNAETTLSALSRDEDNLGPGDCPSLDDEGSVKVDGENQNLEEETIFNSRTISNANCESLEANPGLDRVLSVFIRLRMSLERLHKRNMFPYPVSPLLRLLKDAEALYERES